MFESYWALFYKVNSYNNDIYKVSSKLVYQETNVIAFFELQFMFWLFLMELFYAWPWHMQVFLFYFSAVNFGAWSLHWRAHKDRGCYKRVCKPKVILISITCYSLKSFLYIGSYAPLSLKKYHFWPMIWITWRLDNN